MDRLAGALLWLSMALCVFLAFAWPFLFSDEAAFRVLGMSAFFTFFGALVLRVCRVLRTS